MVKSFGGRQPDDGMQPDREWRGPHRELAAHYVSPRRVMPGFRRSLSGKEP